MIGRLRRLPLAVLLCAAPALAAAPATKSLDPAQLCSAVDSQSIEANPSHDLIVYTYQTQLFRAAGVTPADNATVIAEKVRRTLDADMPRLLCNHLNFNPRNGNLLKLAVARKSTPFIDDVLITWHAGLNQVDATDGLTVLDYIRDRRTEAAPGSSLFRVLDGYYTRFRKAGARHRSELEQAGAVPTMAASVSAKLAELEQRANAGAFDAAMALASAYRGGKVMGQSVAADPALARRWAGTAVGLARSNRDPEVLLSVARWFDDDRAGADPVQAFAWYRRAADLGSADGQFWTGRMLASGRGTARDLRSALPHLIAADAKDVRAAALWLGYVHGQLGDRDTMIGWYRYAVQTGLASYPVPLGERTLGDWFVANGVPTCGRNIKGYDACRK